ncbi:uncharacterized protein A4U43_C04F5800 [Asparagus officinalis]|uniref:Uncharacterized protein n=1 Tax=Asparagus officinalis TaxID=4686 RepID=A0A5P1F315_ASPOF|nr:uncharacterized protein A4U43_C04F5800 [Asparagus officinalis]
MLLDCQIISRKIIKPSSPTPQHSQSLRLSLLDQSAPQIYTHIILFYSFNTTTHPLDQIPLKLQNSLSQILTHFYPLAGKIKQSPSNTLYVDCNDEGVEFVEARTESDLDSFLLDPPIGELNNLLPIKVTEFRWVDDPLLAIQLNIFRGKGLAIAISMSHLIADGISIALFLKLWADVTRGINLNISETPKFDAFEVFPPQSRFINRPLPEYTTKHDNVVIKRFVMSSQAIQKLRKGDHDQTQEPTRVEAVSELIMRCLKRMRMDANCMMITVNLRKKMASSKLSDNSFGNLWINVDASGQERVRSAVRRVDEGYVRRRERSGWVSEGAQIVVGYLAVGVG